MAHVAGAVWKHTVERPQSVALRAGDRQWTYAELRDAAASYAGRMRGRGVTPGDRVLLVAPSVPEFVVACLGAHLVGSVVITMNAMATAHEIGYVLEDSEARLVTAWHESVTSAEKAAAERGVPFWTSGTTGRPKGVELTVSNLVETARIFTEQLELSADDRFGTGLPLFHVYGQAVCLNVEVAVIGVPHEHYGEEVAAVVVTSPGDPLDAEALRTWAKERLSAYKVPHLVRFVEALPKGATGKILKRALDWDALAGVGPT